MRATRVDMRPSPDRATAERILDVSGLSLAYSAGSIIALEDADLAVHSGEIVALLGANGAGKTSLLRAVAGLLPLHGGTVTAGTIRYEGELLGRSAAWHRVRRGISIALEGRRVFPDLDVHENLVAAGITRPRPEARQAYDAVLEQLPVLAEKRAVAAGLLSGGEQQMLAVGRALMQDPRLLLLDEPSLGLAPLIVQRIRDIIVEINGHGCAVLLVEQNVGTALSIADHAYVLANRRIVHDGAAELFLGDDALRDLYLGRVPEATA